MMLVLLLLFLGTTTAEQVVKSNGVIPNSHQQPIVSQQRPDSSGVPLNFDRAVLGGARQDGIPLSEKLVPDFHRFNVFNKKRVFVDGFQPIKRRSLGSRKRRFMPFGDFNEELENGDSTNEGSGEFSSSPPFDATLTSLHPESGYEAVDQEENREEPRLDDDVTDDSENQFEVKLKLFEDDDETTFEDSTSTIPNYDARLVLNQEERRSSVQITDKPEERDEWTAQAIDQEENPEESNLDNDIREESTSENQSDVTQRLLEEDEEIVSEESISMVAFPKENVSISRGTTEKTKATTISQTEVRTVSTQPTPMSSNSEGWFRNKSNIVRIMKEYLGFIVGAILGVPATVVLIYFIHLKRSKRYTGTLDVTPRPSIYSHKKTSYKPRCSQANELCSPTSSTSKTPQPPPFPSHSKNYIP